MLHLPSSSLTLSSEEYIREEQRLINFIRHESFPSVVLWMKYRSTHYENSHETQKLNLFILLAKAIPRIGYA